MELDRDNLSQLEIEEAFDNAKVYDKYKQEIAEYSLSLDNYIPMLDNCLQTVGVQADYLELMETMIFIMTRIGSEYAVPVRGEAENVRDLPIRDFVLGFMSDPTMKSIYKDVLFDVCVAILKDFDTVFFDIHKRTKKLDDGSFITITYLRTEVLFKLDTNLMARYNRFRLPMIEKPDDWTEKQRGGYKLFKRKCTTRKGYEFQPQQSLDALNKLQDLAFTMTECDINFELNYLYQDFLSSGNSEAEAELKARNLLLSVKQTYTAMKGRQFHFEMRFDFRGRMYSTGYDLNPQGNTIKKGLLRPKLF